MPENQIKIIVKEAVHETLVNLGFTVDEPQQIQQDMAYVRRARMGSEEISKWTRRAIISTGISSMAFALWAGIKHLVR